MVLMPDTVVRLGIGVYSPADAAHLLDVPSTTIRRWVGGYTYTGTGPPRNLPPVIETDDLPRLENRLALSFVELMELRVVKRLVEAGVSLQQVRKAADCASEIFRTEHPFASKRVFTDGKKVFAAISSELEPDIVELSKKKREQIISGRVFAPFLEELDFDANTNLAYRWWPLGKRKPIVLDPRISFGAPTVAGTAVRTSTIARVAGGSPRPDVARAYQISVAKVNAALQFEEALAAA
jgi:uncharacterized protein (DUF433 family)/DNA-binding transcriptional MerR regulator